MTTFLALGFLCGLAACKPTYKKEQIRESVKSIVQKEYGLNVEVEEAGNTLGVRFKVKSLLSELYSGDDAIYKKINGIFMAMVRVTLSVDVAPDFIVLDIVDEDNPRFHLIFTRYVEDLRKSMAEALSYSQTQDRLLEEFVIGERRVAYDPQEMDLVRLMMMAVDDSDAMSLPDQPFDLRAVEFKTFISHVAENTLKRLLREEKSVSKNAQIRQVSASFARTPQPNGNFQIFLDVVSQPSAKLSPIFLEATVLPMVAKEAAQLFKSYRFRDFEGITVIEKNSGKMLTVPSS